MKIIIEGDNLEQIAQSICGMNDFFKRYPKNKSGAVSSKGNYLVTFWATKYGLRAVTGENKGE